MLSRNLPELIKAGFDFVKSLIEGVIAALADFKIDNVDDLNKAVENLLGIMLMLGAMSVIFPFALAGVLGLGTIAVALTGVVAALGAISKIQGVSYLVSSGGDQIHRRTGRRNNGGCRVATSCDSSSSFGICDARCTVHSGYEDGRQRCS